MVSLNEISEIIDILFFDRAGIEKYSSVAPAVTSCEKTTDQMGGRARDAVDTCDGRRVYSPVNYNFYDESVHLFGSVGWLFCALLVHAHLRQSNLFGNAFSSCKLAFSFQTHFLSNFFQDIVAGLVLALFLMIPMVPLVDYIDNIWMTEAWSPFAVFFIAVAVIIFFPHSEHWTPTWLATN